MITILIVCTILLPHSTPVTSKGYWEVLTAVQVNGKSVGDSFPAAIDTGVFFSSFLFLFLEQFLLIILGHFFAQELH